MLALSLKNLTFSVLIFCATFANTALWAIDSVTQFGLALPTTPTPPVTRHLSLVIETTSSIFPINWVLTDDCTGTRRPGRWTVLRFVCANGEKLKVPSPASNGLATDHFSAEATGSHIEHLTNRLRARFGDLCETALKQWYLPSHEARGQVRTPEISRVIAPATGGKGPVAAKTMGSGGYVT